VTIGRRVLDSLDSELTSEIINPFRHIGRTPLTGDRHIATPLLMQESTTQIRTRDLSVRKAQDNMRLRHAATGAG
jgi:hypothetical protein